VAKIREITSGLRAPEGPVALKDGSVLVVELKGGALTRVAPDGKKEVVAEVGGAPNGAAVGPDGKIYICNNGGLIFAEISGHTLPIPGLPPNYTLTRQIPLRVRRRGIEMRLVIGGGSGSAPRIDSTILKATARARRWFHDLVSGRAASMVEIGKREGVGKRYVSRLIRLAFLAPAIIERIAEGRQPPELTAQFLSTGRGDLPLSWSAQEQLLGFADPA
jgi:hypothetical protein